MGNNPIPPGESLFGLIALIALLLALIYGVWVEGWWSGDHVPLMK